MTSWVPATDGTVVLTSAVRVRVGGDKEPGRSHGIWRKGQNEELKRNNFLETTPPWLEPSEGEGQARILRENSGIRGPF